MNENNPIIILFVCMMITVSLTIIGICIVGFADRLIGSARNRKRKS